MTGTLTLRRSYPDSDFFWTVIADGEVVGYIVYREHVGDESIRWQWSVHVMWFPPGGIPFNRHGTSASREDAMAAFKETWVPLRALMGDEGWAGHVEHEAQMRARKEMNAKREWKPE